MTDDAPLGATNFSRADPAMTRATRRATGAQADPAPLTIAAVDCTPLCHAFEWEVADEGLLVKHVAQLAAGHAEVVRAALLRLSYPSLSAPPQSAATAAIAQLEARRDGSLRYHRDGWLFQLIAWVAAIQTAVPGDIVRAPQPQMAQHGLDGLIVHLNRDGSAVAGVSICEQKASKNPRSTVVSEVWPGFGSYERAERDHQLLAEVTALLQTQAQPNAVALADAIHWQRSRRYRVAVTIEGGKRGPAGLTHVFAGYDAHVIGDAARRRGEALRLAALRAWMDHFAASVLAELRRHVT